MQAFVEFTKEVYASDALQFHRMNMDSRYVEVFKSNRFEMTQVRGPYLWAFLPDVLQLQVLYELTTLNSLTVFQPRWRRRRRWRWRRRLRSRYGERRRGWLLGGGRGTWWGSGFICAWRVLHPHERNPLHSAGARHHRILSTCQVSGLFRVLPEFFYPWSQHFTSARLWVPAC